MRGFAEFRFEKKELDAFEAKCEFAIRNVARGTKKATDEAVRAIMRESLNQVPRMTWALMASAYYEVRRRSDTANTTWAYEGIMGYGGNGDPINPKTGRPVSSYMVAVHEDLKAHHPIGKAKFLEDPVREYGEKHFKRTVFKYARESLARMSD